MNFTRYICNIRSAFFILLGAISFDGNAAPRIFECRGSQISVDIPEYIEISRAGDECVFWRKGDAPDYSGYYFGGSLRVDENGTKKSFDFQGSSDSSEGTWERLLKKKTVVVIENKNRYMRIDQGDYKIKFLSAVSETETVEKIDNITRIEGEVLDKGVWVHLSFAIPYKNITRDKSIEIIKSVKVLSGFDAGAKDPNVHD